MLFYFLFSSDPFGASFQFSWAEYLVRDHRSCIGYPFPTRQPWYEVLSRYMLLWRRFCASWFSIPEIGPWLEESVLPNHAFCKFCQKDLTAGKSELFKHLRTAKHKKKSAALGILVGAEAPSVQEVRGGSRGPGVHMFGALWALHREQVIVHGILVPCSPC